MVKSETSNSIKSRPELSCLKDSAPRLLQVSAIARTIHAFLLPFADHFRSKGWYVAAAAGELDHIRPSLESHFDRVHSVPWARSLLSFGNYTSAVRKIRHVVREGAYDLVHVHTPIAAFLTRFALRNLRSRTKVIYTAHGFHFGHSANRCELSPFFWAEKIASRWTDGLVLINTVDLELARRYNLAHGGRIFYTPGIGVDVSDFARRLAGGQRRSELRNQLKIADNDFMLVMIAEFHPRKRHRDLIRAIKHVDCKNLKVIFCGDGRDLQKMKTLAAELDVEKSVEFLGFRNDVPDLIQAADATVLPADREGLPRCIMESMALGVPVIGTRTRGIEELLANGAGLLVNVGDVQDLSAAIKNLIDNPSERNRLARAGLERIKSYDVTRVLECYERIYSDVLGFNGGI